MNLKSFPSSYASSYASWVGARTQSALRRSPSTIKTTWLDVQRQAVRDFRTRSGRGGLWMLAVLWICGLTTSLVILSVWSVRALDSRNLNSRLSACLPDGEFSLRPETYQYWSRSGFFEITLGSGDLSFPQAKAIDVIWDIVIGRGGQGLLAYFSWQTFVRYVTTSMEVQPVTFNTYRMIFLQNESLILGIPRLIRDFCKCHSLHSRFAMVFMVMTMIFVLAFPTIGSAMTGYSGNVMPYVPDSAGNFVPFNNFSIVLYTIHDGSRINKTDDYHVTIYKSSYNHDDPKLTDIDYWTRSRTSTYYPYYSTAGDCTSYKREHGREECESENMIWNVSQYITLYGPHPQTGKSSMFGDASISSPTLNITAYDLPSRLNKTQGGEADPPNVNTGQSAMFVSSNQLYRQQDIARDGKCQAQKTYQWGFSFVQLNIMIILLWVWTFGILVMYVTSKFTRLQRGRGDVAGEYKAVFELSDAMHAQLDTVEEEDGKDIRQITESTLRRRITKDLGGGSISYDTAILSKNEELAGGVDWALKALVIREMPWLIAIAMAITIDGFVIKRFFLDAGDGVRDDLWFPVFLPLAIGFAMYVGLTHSSRAMVLFWAMLVMCVLPAIVLKMVLYPL